MENLGELQPLAVKAGLNGVMMGNFLTTLGSAPEDDRALFEDLGLNVARQPDNGTRPRPDNRSGWLEGGTPDVVAERLASPPANDGPLDVRLWDPSSQLRFRAKRSVPPRPDGAPNAAPPAQRAGGLIRLTGRDEAVSEFGERLDELRRLGLYRRLRLVSGPQGPSVLLDGKPVLLLCSNNYLGLADHPRVREAAAEAAMRWGAGAGASRLVSGTMTVHRRLEERLAAFESSEACVLFGSGYLANIGVVSALAGRGDVVFSDRLNHASLIDGCRLSGARAFVYDHLDVDHLAWGLRRAREENRSAAALIVTDSVFSMDGDVAPLAEIVELAGRHGARCGRGRGPRHRNARPGRTRRGRRGRPRGCGRRGGRHARQGARLLRRLRVRGDRPRALPDQRGAAADLLHRAPPPAAVAGALAALDLLEEQPERVDELRANARTLREALAPEGLLEQPARLPHRAAAWWATPASPCACARRRSSAGSSPRRSARRPCPRAPRA